MTGAVSEFEILQATALWFVQSPRKGFIEKIIISPPSGNKGFPSVEEQKRILGERLNAAGFGDFQFCPHGPDLVVMESERQWRVECKGLTGGKRSTLDNNFDRALASVVSYYDEPSNDDPVGLADIIEGFDRPKKPVRLVLALPDDPKYRTLLKKRVRPALRRKLDLWVLLVDTKTPSVNSYDPEVSF